MEPSTKVFVLPNEFCRRVGVAATWSSIGEFALFPSQSVKTQAKDVPSLYAPGDASVFRVRQEVILFHPILRKLINEATGIFLSIQALMSEKNPEYKSELVKMSRQYRSIIRACLEYLQDEVMQAKGSEREELESFITIFYSVECIWHLCEILFIDDKPRNMVLSPLLDWVRFHIPKYERKAAILISGGLVGLESQPTYWETVIGSLMQGRVDVVRGLLRLHSASDTNPFKLVDQILKAMPMYNIYSGVSLTEFNLKWKHWIVDTQSKLDAKLFISEKNLELIVRLVVGEELAWSEVQSHCEAWYELLAAWLFYTEPNVKSFELGQFARTCIQRMGMRDRMSHLDRVLLAAMEYDLLQVIKEIQLMTENGWFVTHLADLLYHAGQLEEVDKLENNQIISNKLREFFLIDYGSLLMSHPSLWQVGLSYLDYCPSDGLNIISLLLPRLPMDSEMRINKIVREAQKRNLHTVAQSICKVQVVRSIKRGRLGNALTWALKSKNRTYVTFLADKYLREYCRNGKLMDVDLLDNLGASILASDTLIFLGKYCEFHKVYQMGDLKEAADILVSLISSKITPKYFWVTLFSDALPLLESENLVFSSTDTYILLNALEERLDIPGLDGKVEVLRIAISRNLARALIYEAQYN